MKLSRILAAGLVAMASASLAAAAVSEIRINFQPEGEIIPNGYLPDYGYEFGTMEYTPMFDYGWETGIQDETRQRSGGDDQRYDTIVHLQDGHTWEIALQNMEYSVYIVAGDPQYDDQTNTLLIEGMLVEDPDGQSSGDHFDELTANVTVSDGRLTISPGPGADNPKMAFLHITPIPEPATMSLLGVGIAGVLARRRRR